ncbi:P-loop NTPase fold protein [Microbacterium testaceum]|nr:P-loop NTPase fold protein [Microbacterium testaceum]
MTQDPAGGAFSDEALTDPDEDALGRAGFLDSIVTLLERVGSRSESTVVAVVGRWGLGKSTVLNAVTTRLRRIDGTRRRWIVAEFNPWYYQDLVSLQQAFFRELAEAVPSGASWKKVREGIASFAETVAPLGALGGLIGVDATRIIEQAANATRGNVGVLEAKAAVEKALLKVDRPVLVVIDDVDRLDPQELLLLFKLIRLAGRLPNVYYLLAYDEDTLLDALSRTGLIGEGSARRALDYMEKIVQLRLDVPPVRERQLATWIDREVGELAARLSVTMDQEQRRRFDQAYYSHIRSRLQTPRAIKRFLAQVESLAAGLSQEVDFVDFLILSWIRASEPLVYRAIIDQRSRLLGELDPTGRIWPGDRDAGADHAYWSDVLTRSRVDSAQLSGVADLLSQLFPNFAEQWGVERSGHVGSVRHGRIAHKDYFDRFFAFGVPDDDLSDRTVEKACAEIIAGASGPEREVVERKWPDETSLIIGKLNRYWDPGRVDGVVVLRWLAIQAIRLPALDYLPGTPYRETVHFAQSHFTHLRGDRPLAAVRAMADEDPSLRFAEDVISVLRGGMAPPETRNAEFAAAKTEFAARASTLFDAQGDTNPLDYPTEIWDLFGMWLAADESAVRRWADKHLADGSWPLLDLLAQMVSRAVPLGVPDPPTLVGDLNLAEVDRTVGLDRVRRELADEIEQFDKSLPNRAVATPENRRAVALRALKVSHDS